MALNEFFSLIRQGDEIPVEQMLKMHPNWVDARLSGKCTPMHLSAIHGRDFIVKMLMNHGSAAMKMEDMSGCVPLHLAAMKGHDSTVDLLCGANIDHRNLYGRTPLHYAAASGHQSTVALLLHRGSQAIDLPDIDGNTPLHLAAYGHEMVIYEREMTSLNVFEDDRDHRPTVELLLRSGSTSINTPNRKEYIPLHMAVKAGKHFMIEFLLRSGSNPIDTPLSNGRTCVHLAVSRGRLSTINFVLRLAPGLLDVPDNKGYTPLHVAVKDGWETKVRHLLRLGSQSMDAMTNDGYSPVHFAVHAPDGDHQSILQILQAVGANTDVRVDPEIKRIALIYSLRWLDTPVHPRVAANIRHQIYFSLPLLSRLLEWI